MRKPAFCIYECENKCADQLHGNRAADQRLCFRYIDHIIPLLSKFQATSHLTDILCGCTAGVVLELVRDPVRR